MDISTLNTEELLERADILYSFNMLFSDYEQTLRDYGNGVLMTMSEIHILDYINEKPGITAAEIADHFLITASAVSQVLSRLEKRAYITREHQSGKKKLIYPTEIGTRLCNNHRAFDIQALSKTYNYLLRDCLPEEIQTFYKVMKVYNNIMLAGRRKRLVKSTG